MFIYFFFSICGSRLLGAARSQRKEKVVVAGGQLKYRCLTVGVIPFCHDLHLEQSPKARHSTLVQEIKADSDLMRKVNLPSFLRGSRLNGALQLCP